MNRFSLVLVVAVLLASVSGCACSKNFTFGMTIGLHDQCMSIQQPPSQEKCYEVVR